MQFLATMLIAAKTDNLNIYWSNKRQIIHNTFHNGITYNTKRNYTNGYQKKKQKGGILEIKILMEKLL